MEIGDLFDQLEEWEEYPHLLQNKTKLVEYFHVKFDCREIGYSTFKKFNDHLRFKYQEIAPRYDLMFDLYQTSLEQIKKPGRYTDRQYSATGTDSNTSTSSVSSKGDNSQYDTPKTNLPNPLSHPSMVSTSESQDTNELSSNLTREATETEHLTTTDQEYIDALNNLGDKYRSLMTDFILEFERLFLGSYILYG